MENRIPRQVYIVPKGYDQEKALREAGEWGCPEIAWGIPPVLQNTFQEKDLPLVYAESLPGPVPEPVDLVAEIVGLKARVVKIEGKVGIQS